MLALERQKRIIEQIEKEESVKVIELSKAFDVTEETIRRDLEKLEKQGILKRTYGGAVLETSNGKEAEDTPFNTRVKQNITGKQKIALAVASLLKDNEVVMLDPSTTCLEIAKRIDKEKHLTVITNSISVLSELSNHEALNILSTGGTLRKRSLSLIGPTAKDNIRNYYADKAVISCKGADLHRGLMDTNELEIEIKKAMISCAKEIILAIDSTKIEKKSMYKLMELKEVDYIVVDAPLSEEWVRYCKDNTIQAIICE
ncbi:DeoR family transcriptional regulator [Sporanaerobium hydrogeniformans]|uniref:DeoR family transcriptional regulator n=1 Tax=Sporanaerobium hydrogeniformans TaxID=3072179 RepID=A0AC61DFX5_9FIRM|nr:DeoR/GlpR family DNA-binding transcription regulator [Sporanaerobium hydrogeniformans]PHV72114.1 DeoR family transcriptional regulator [Sporanaerobium hydrogeniformans]